MIFIGLFVVVCFSCLSASCHSCSCCCIRFVSLLSCSVSVLFLVGLFLLVSSGFCYGLGVLLFLLFPLGGLFLCRRCCCCRHQEFVFLLIRFAPSVFCRFFPCWRYCHFPRPACARFSSSYLFSSSLMISMRPSFFFCLGLVFCFAWLRLADLRLPIARAMRFCFCWCWLLMLQFPPSCLRCCCFFTSFLWCFVLWLLFLKVLPAVPYSFLRLRLLYLSISVRIFPWL